MYNFVYRSVRQAQSAEDVCQEVWTKAYRELGKLREPSAFSVWLYRIASRACIDSSRRRGPLASELSEDLPAPKQTDPAETAVRNERERLVWEALASLPVRQHQALFLREVEGRSYQEIAGILETTQSAVETLLFRSRRALAEAYQRLEAATTERCGQARRTMAALLDGEATPVQRRAIEAHADQCRVCRVQFGQMGRASAAYGLLPLLPVPALLGQRVLAGLGASSSAVGAAGGGGTLSKLLTLGLTKVQLATAALTITGGLVVGAVVGPSDSPRLASTTAAVPAASADGVPASAGPAQATQPATQPTSALSLTGRVPALAEASALLDRIVAHAVELSTRPVVVPLSTLPAALPAVPVPAVALPTLPVAPTAPIALPKLPLPQPTALPVLPRVP